MRPEGCSPLMSAHLQASPPNPGSTPAVCPQACALSPFCIRFYISKTKMTILIIITGSLC